MGLESCGHRETSVPSTESTAGQATVFCRQEGLPGPQASADPMTENGELVRSRVPQSLGKNVRISLAIRVFLTNLRTKSGQDDAKHVT